MDALKPGDLIYITAPAKAIEKEHVDYATKFLEDAGFRVRVGDNCLGSHHYFSGTDDERLADMQAGLDDPEVKAILCARGGYGCVRLVDRINWAGMLQNPKWLIGFSDITVFHQRIQRFDLPSIHGSMCLNFKDNTKEALSTMIDALTGKDYTIQCNSSEYNRVGSADGVLVGGNLSIIYSLLGTDDQIDYSDKILFIEDLAEHLYHIDRMCYALAKAGVFDKIRGLIVGGMTDLEDTATPFGKTYQEIILDHFTYRKIPIAFDIPAGHIDDNRALILGGKCSLQVNETETSIHFLNPAQ